MTRNVYAERVRQVLGGFAFQLGHVDALAFTAGLGENDSSIREAILDLLQEAMGIKYDKALNHQTRGEEVRISTDDSAVEVWVVPTDEELVLARDAFELHHE